MRRAVLASLFLSTFASACGSGSLGPGDREPECLDDRDCGAGFVCERDLCVPPRRPGDPLPDGGTAECDFDSDCPGDFLCDAGLCVAPVDACGGSCVFPTECRDGVCVAPDDDGDVCEFDPECGAGNLCIAGRCTPDPRIPRTCLDGEECPDGLMCSMDGACICVRTADCPIGAICSPDGRCVPDGDSCIADDECPPGLLCAAGECIPESACDVVHPPLQSPRVWSVDSVYNFREALPSWLSGFLDAVAAPLRFLSGTGPRPSLGIPRVLEDLVWNAIESWIDANVPAYARDAAGGIADLNDILSTWFVKEQMTLTSAAPPRDAYRGQNVWTEVEFEYRGARMRGRPADIIDWTFEPSEYDAQAVCGVFYISQHDVNVGIGAIIAWAVNAVVEQSSSRRYRTAEAMLRAQGGRICNEVGNAARRIETEIDLPLITPAEAYDLARTACLGFVDGQIDRLVDALDMARLRLDVMSLKGSSPIVSGTSMTPGTWEGSLVGGDFTGTWSARR